MPTDRFTDLVATIRATADSTVRDETLDDAARDLAMHDPRMDTPWTFITEDCDDELRAAGEDQLGFEGADYCNVVEHVELVAFYVLYLHYHDRLTAAVTGRHPDVRLMAVGR